MVISPLDVLFIHYFLEYDCQASTWSHPLIGPEVINQPLISERVCQSTHQNNLSTQIQFGIINTI